MKSSYACPHFADFGPFSVKEWLCVLILLIPGTLCSGNISLAIINFSPSEVELACHGSYDGNMTSTFFDVYRGRFSCLHRSSNRCRETLINDCSIFCLASADLNTLPFWVKLDERCDETMVVRCLIRSAASGTILDLEESIKLTAHSYPPEISVNDGQPVKASSDQVRIVCTVRNKCNKTKMEINVEANMQQVSTTHTLEGSRFTTTTLSTAIFSDPGNYTIACKETGKDVQYSRNYTLVVDPGETVTQQMKGETNSQLLTASLASSLTVFFSIFLLGLCLFWCVKQRKKKKNRSDTEAIPLLATSKDDRYKIIEEVIQQLTHLNIENCSTRIFSLVNEGEITYPEYRHSIVYQVIGKMEDLHRTPQYPILIESLLPSYQKSALSKKEDLSEIIWEKLEYGFIRDGTEAQKCLRKLKNFPLDVTSTFRLLWRCALDSIILEEIKKLTPYHWKIARFLIRKFKSKEACFADKTEQFIDPQCKINAPFLQEILDGYKKTVTNAGVLDFLIQSVPDFILKHESDNISSIKEIFVKECCKMLHCEEEDSYNPSEPKRFSNGNSLIHKSFHYMDCEILESNEFCNHVDVEGRTPLHKLLEKLLSNDLWREISELVAGTGSVWDLMSQLISYTDVNIRDKNKITSYSWILWWKESIPYQDVPDRLNLENKVDEILQHCQKKMATEEDACHGLKIHREREMERLLTKLMKSKMNIIADEETFRKVQTKIERVKGLKRIGCGACITDLAVKKHLGIFAKNHMDIWNDRVLELSQVVLELLITEVEAQQVYDVVLKKKNGTGDNGEKVNYIALFGVLKLCLDKGACPTSDQILEVSLLNMDQGKAHEAQLTAVRIMESLIDAYRRKQVNNEPIHIYLNPIQDQWKVSETLRNVAGEVIRKAYPSLVDCILSESVINILLFLGKENNIESICQVEKCFQKVNEFLQKDNTTLLATKWAEEKLYEHFQAVEENEIKQMLVKRNDNWLKRSVLHLAAIFCQDEQVLKKIPEEIIKKEKEGKDVNGYTPLHIARLHENWAAIKFFERPGARSDENLPKELESPCTVQYEKCCSDIMANSSVFEPMKSMLILTVDEGAALEKDLKELFTRMLAQNAFPYDKIVIGGSMREKLQVGYWNDFNLQIHMKRKPYQQKPLASLKLHRLLVKRLAEIDTTKSSLRCISVGDPWKFIWDGEERCKGLQISVDVMFILIDTFAKTMNERPKLIMDQAPSHGRHRHLQRNDLMSEALWHDTFFLQEWDILDNLPPQCRLGILIAMALIEAHDQTTPVTFMKSPITKDVLKNTLLWILAGRTPRIIEIAHGNVIREQYGALRQQLYFEEGDTRWMTEEDLKRYAKDGRFWAEKIFDAIAFMAKKYKATLDSFLTCQSHELTAQEATVVQNICKRCLERLTPPVFFIENASGSSEMESDEGSLRKRLEEVIDKLNGKLGKVVPGARLWKLKRECKELKERIDNCSAPMENILNKQLKKQKESEVRKLRRDFLSQPRTFIKEEQFCKEISDDIKNVLKILGDANREESNLFRQYGGCIESPMNTEKCKLEESIKTSHNICKTKLAQLEEKSRKLLTAEQPE